MRRRIPIPVAIVVLAAFAVIAGSKAFAFFGGPGSGTAEAKVNTLTAPVISAATAGANGTVTLTWGAVTPPGSGTVTYYVTRDGGKPAGNCPTVEAPTTVVTCKDEGVSIAEHSYQVIAKWSNWTATSAVKTAKVTIGEAVKFTISGSTTTPATGAAVNLTVTAKDVANSTVTGYTGSHSLVFSGASTSPGGNAPTVSNSSGSAIAFGATTALTFTSGVATVSGSNNGVLRVYNAGPASITATEGSVTTPTPLALTASVTASRFVLKAATTTPAAGAEDDLTITAQDAYGNLATTYTGSKSLTFSGASASAGGNTPTVTNSSGTAIAFGSVTTIEFTEGVADPAKSAAGTAVLYKAEASAVKVAEGSTVTMPTGLTITPTPGVAAKLVLTSSTATPTAGSTFNFTTTAQDVYGNTATSYAGSKNITFSGAEASPNGTVPTVVNSAGTATPFGSATALTFTNGVAAVSASKNGLGKLTKAGATSVTASDGTFTTPALPLTVAVGAANRVGVTGLTASAGSISSPCLNTCTVTALGNLGTIKAKAVITDSSGNLITNVGAAKTVNVTVTSGGTIVGSPLTVPASGSAVSSTEFTYTAPASGSFTHTITLASSGYTAGTVTASK